MLAIPLRAARRQYLRRIAHEEDRTMTSHLSGERIERYLARTLSPADVLSFHDHIEACAECRQAVEEATLARGYACRRSSAVGYGR